MVYQFYVNPKSIEGQIEILKNQSCNIVVETNRTSYFLNALVEGVETDKIAVSFELLDFMTIQNDLNSVSIIFDSINKSIPIHQFERMDNIGSDTEKYSERFADFICDVNWKSVFQLNVDENAVGIDAITNAEHKGGVIVTECNPRQRSGRSGYSTVKIVSTSKDLSTLLSAELSGKYTMGDLEFRGSSEYLKSIKCSEKELSIILIDKRYEENYMGDYKFALTKEAIDFAKKCPEGFREKYGDYFISDVKKGAYFYAVYNFKSESREELDRLQIDLSSKSDLFKFSTSEEFQKKLDTSNIKLEVNVFSKGCSDMASYKNIKDVIDVGKALQWYSEHLQFVPIYAKLTHYSCLPDSPITNKIPYKTEKFLEIKSLYSDIMELHSNVQNVPEIYSSVKDSVMMLYTEIMNSLSKITWNDKYRETYMDKVSKMKKKLRVFLRILADKGREPKAGMEQKSNNKENAYIWEYGCMGCDGSEIVEIPFIKTFGVGWQERDIIFNQAPNDEGNKKGKKEKIPIIILGYRLTSNWTDGSNGEWWKLSNHGLLDEALNIHIRSWYGRGCNWRCEICYIKKEFAGFES